MPRHKPSGAPNAAILFSYAYPQLGFFTAAQAEGAGYSRSLLAYYLETKKISRPLRGIFVFNGVQPPPQSPLIPFWLWSHKEGIFGHDSALFLHEHLKDPPAIQRMFLPRDAKRRRLRVPEGLEVSYEDIPPWHRQQIGPFWVTTPERSNADRLRTGGSFINAPARPQPNTEPPRYKTMNEELAEDLDRIIEELGYNHLLTKK